MTPRLYTKAEVADILGFSVSKIEKMMKSGRITFLKIGGQIRFRPIDIAPFFEGTVTPLDRKLSKTESEIVRAFTGTYGRIREQR